MSNVHDKNIKLIYDKLTSKGVDMGTLEETTKALRSDPRNGRLLYDMGTKHGYDMGSYEEFEEAMGLPKFQAPFKYGEEPIKVGYAQPETEEPKKEEDYLTTDMPEEAEAEEEYDFNREALKDYVPQFKSEIKEKFPNARMFGFSKPVQLGGPGMSYVGEDAYLTIEDRQKKNALSEQLKLGQITKEQYETEEKAIQQKAIDKMNDQFSEDTLNASAALHLMTQAQKRVKLVDGRKKSRIVNTFRGIGHFDYAGLNPTLQYIDAYRSFALLNKVAENPDAELSESEQYLLQAIVTNNAVNDTFQTNMAERIGQGLPESMAFMAQFALTGGVGSAVGKLAKEGVEEVIKKGLKNATRRLYDDGFKGLIQKGLDRTLNTVIPGVVGATTAAATQTVLNPASLASGTYERAAGTAEYTLAPDGTPIATGEVTGRMGLDEAFAKEFGAQTIEQLSERAGASLGIGLGAGKAVAKTTGKAIASKVPGVQKAADAFVEFADNMKKTKVGDLVGKAAEWLENKDLGVKALAQKVGWNGTIEEWYEEQANTVLNALFVGDEELSALFNGERQLETFLSVAVVGGATRLLSAPAAIEQRAEVRKEKQNLKNTISDIEKRVRGNSTMSNALKAVATAADTGTVEDVALAINEANRQLNLDTDTQRMFLDYASARMMSNMWHSNDRRQASKLAEGVYKEVEARTHKQSGTITVAEYTDAQGNKQNVDIIDGVIIRDEDKKIDSTLSDRSVVIRFQDGTTKMVPSKSLGNIVEEIDPAQYRAKLANANARDMASTFFSEYSARTNKHGVYYNEDGSLDYYHATPGQIALSLIDELGSAEAAAEYAANQLIGLQGAEMTSAEGGDGMSIETQNALSKWQAVSGLLADTTAYNAQQAAAAEGKAPEGVEPMENPLPVDAAAPARNLRAGDRLRLTLDNGEMAEATIGGKTADGNYIVDFEDNVTIGGKKGASHELTPEVIAAMQYVEEVQEGEEELQAEQTPEQDDVTSYKDMVIGRIPLKADGSRNWEAATPTEAAQAINAERDGDFDASIAFAQQMAQNCANAVADLSNTELEVEDPTNADMVAAAEAQRAQAIASMQKTAYFWDEVTNILNTANAERTKPAEQETPAVETTTVEESSTSEDSMPMLDEDTPDFVSAGPERSAEFLSEQFGDDAEGFIQDNIAEAQKTLADAQGKKSKSTNFAERKRENEAIAQEKMAATAALDFWNAVGAAYAARQSAVAEEVAQPEVVESAEQPKIRGRKQVVKFLKDAREADASDNALGALSAIFLVEDSVRLGDSGAITAEEQAEVDAIKAKYAAQGYVVVVDMVGKPYHQGLKVIAQFVEDDSRYENESPIIKSVRKPQINRNGKLVQAAEITVAQGSKVRQTSQTKPTTLDGVEFESNLPFPITYKSANDDTDGSGVMTDQLSAKKWAQKLAFMWENSNSFEEFLARANASGVKWKPYDIKVLANIFNGYDLTKEQIEEMFTPTRFRGNTSTTAVEETPVEKIATEEKAEENKEVSDVNSEKDTNFVGESEATPEETPEEEITVEMIENTDLDEVIKVMAIDYLNGNVNVATKAAYDAVKDYVRNISTVRPADSTDAGRAQLGEGADDAGSLASGQSRGVSGDLDSREDGGVVSDGDGVRSEAGEDDLAEPPGIGGDNSVGTGGHEPDVVSGIVSSGRVRSGSDSERRPSSRNPRRGKGSSNGVSAQNEGGRGETQRGGDTRDSQEREVKEQEVKDDLARHIQELKDILANPMGEAKGALLDVTSVFGMFGVNAIKVMGATAKIGMDLVKLGYYKFKKWSAAMHESLDGVFHSQTELTDELIDEFIRAMWDTSFKYRGEVRKISEWASLLEAEQLRTMMRMSIEEKRKLQKAAENEPTILGDIENIRKSLPFLLPAQQEDVEKAEFQFFDESHKDAAYGYGKGYMFTNGTGTGKTYTGLGIIKRFIKQGKGRILIVTASGEKIDDWVKDAKNLGITATRLADTKSKGKGVVVTQYANLRQNYELLKDEFDLIVYDESHKLMENQAGEDTNAAAAHYMITNRDAEQAILRTLQDTPLWKEPRKLEEELKELVSLLGAKKLSSEQLKRAEQLGGKVVMEERVSAIRARLTEIAKLQEAEVKKQLQDPEKRAAAEAAVARTKVVFLSATPFNTALNLDYVEGYIFSYPTEEGKERDREKDKERFIMDKFPSSHRRAKQGVVRIDETQIQDADAVTAEEIAFSDYLQNSLHTMSGRGLDSEWDYSREFPKLEVTGARLVNAAIAALTTGKYSALRPYFKHLLDDYAQSTAFFEVIKTSAAIERIKEHIALGRKVVVFHRRMSSTEPLEPPFARGLDNADHDERASTEMIQAFRREFAELLAWEQRLDYRFPQDILVEAFATEEEKAKYQKEQEEYELKLMNHALGIEKKKPKMPKLRSAKVGVFNGKETETEKHKAVDAFNTDGSERSLLVVQVAAGKEGISLHDKTGKHQRVMMSMQLPQSPIEFVQSEGRIYRVGNKSNAIFEYPVLGIDQEIIGFAAKINGRAATTENLALGSRARGLRNSISRAMLASREIPVSPTQGVGGKQLDSREEWEKTDYDGAIEAYNNRNTESEATTDFNEQDTPEPIGYKMMEWARPEAGESILEPAAGTGTMAQYAPQKSRLTAIEIITKKFATLITKVGGSGRKLLNEDFMGFDKRNKFDCVVMNTPHTGEVAVNALIAPQGVPQKEFEFLDKVFGHINEGGRIVALIEEKNADATIKAVTNLGKNRVVVGEVKLPAFAFPNANGGTATRVVVFDVVSNEALRSAMPEKVSFDLSGETTPQGLFEAMRDVQMPERTIDKVARLAKKLQKFEAKFKSFKNVVQRGKNYRTGKMEQEVNFDADRAFLSVRTAQGSTYRIGVGGYYFNLYIRGNEIAAGNMGEITNLCNVYKSLKQITDAQTDEEFRYLTRNYEPKTYPEIRDFLEVCKDAISTALGKTESQIINIAEGRVENELRGELTFKQMKDAFEGLSHGDVTLDDLSKKVFEVVGKIEGLRFYTKSGVPGSTVAYYTPKENAIVINEDTWNSLRLTDGVKAQTVVHEMIHAVTSYYLRQYELGVRFGEEINQACQDIFDVYKAITSDRSFEAGLMQGSKQGDNATYGLTSVQEMIAELANPKFRVQLKLKKLWRQLVNGIKKLLGINLEMGDAQETTALETLENALDTLLSNYNPEYYSQYVGFVNASPNPMEFVRFKIDEDITAEEQEIIAKAKANGTYLKAPNGKPTNLTLRQWVQVRTNAFKRWFGNWDIGAMVTPIHRSKGGFKNLTEAEKWAKENLQGKSVRNLFTNEEISIGSKSIKEMLDPKFAKNVNEQVHMSALQSVLDFIKTGIPAEIHKDTKERGFDVMRLYNAIEIDDVVYRVKSTVRKVKQGDRYYTYEVQEMELLEDTQEALGLLNTDNGRQLNSNNSITGANLLKGVKKTNSNEDILSYSKIVDANGEPLVVYHGSNWKGITTFDRSQSKRRRSGLREYGHFFTTNRALAEMYAAVEDAPDVKEEIDSLDVQIEQAAEAKDIGKMLDLYTEKERITRNLGGRVYEVFLNLRDVAEFDADYQADNGWYNLKADVGYKTAIGRDAMEAYAGQNSMTGDRLRKDGIIGRNIIDLFVGTENKEALKPYYDKYGGDVFLVFDPQNIKSATENVGTFDANNPDIRYRTASEEARQRAIAVQAQTLSTAEIEEYVNEVAKSLPEGVKVVVTNSVESGDREHSGWYDMGTDTVYINADMCDNTADVDATIVHELVGHRSMPTAIARVIGRTNATDRIALYTKLATMLPKELLDRIMTKTVANMDLGVAVDEVLAEAVENAALIKPSLWQRICSEVRAFFRRVLNRGISLSDGDIKYMFWLAAHNINNDAEFVAAEEMRYRAGVAEFKRNSALPTEEQQEYDAAVISKSQQFVEEWVDSLNPLKTLQEIVAKHHGELKSWENAYDIELGRASRTMARSKMMGERFLKPLITAISAFTNNGISREEVNYYMIAKHGLERNEYFRNKRLRELNAQINEFAKEVAQGYIYKDLSDEEKATLVKSQFIDYEPYLNMAEVEKALEWYASNDADYMGSAITNIEAIPLEDMSGLTGLAEVLNEDPDVKPEEIFTEVAEKLVEEFEGENGEAVNTLWDKVRDLTNATLLYQTEGGILSQEQYQNLRSMYRYYIPLRGWAEETSDAFYEYPTGDARLQTVVKTAGGRKSLAEDPIAHMANMLESAVFITEKNAAKQALVRMALNRADNSLLRVVKMRYVKTKLPGGRVEWTAQYPTIPEKASQAEVDAILAQFDADTKAMVAAGTARVKRTQLDVGVMVKPEHKDAHFVKAMINGEEVAVVLNATPAAAIALNGDKTKKYDEQLKTMGALTRFYAKTHTTWAPKFVVTNFLRDWGYSSFSAYVRYGVRYTARFEKNILKWKGMIKMMSKDIHNITEEQYNDHSLIANPTLRYFVEFLTNGGETGFSTSMATEEWKKEIDKQLSDIKGSKLDPRKAVNAMLNLLEFANRYMEDVPRFAAYLTSREMGKNIAESIKDAKEITVNFSRHGAGGSGNAVIRKLYAFANAGIQGLYNLTTLAKEHPKRFYPAVGTIFLSGFAIPLLNGLLISLFGDDEDEQNYRYMTEFNNTNRLVVFNPFDKDGGFITLPISQSLVPFYGLGNIFSRRLMGYDADLSLGGQIASTILAASPLSFISDSAKGLDLAGFAPSFFQPIADVLLNKDFMGNPIFRSYDYGNGNTNKGDAAFTKAPIDTWQWLVWLSKQTSRLTGGDGIIRRGLADFNIGGKLVDWQINNPAIIQYLLESYLGGALQSASKVVNLGKGVVAKMTGDETRAEEYLAAYNLPLVSGLYRFSNETSANSRIKEAYDHYRNDVAKQCERAVKTYMEELPADLNLWPKAAVEVLNSTDYQIYKLLKDYDKPIRKAEKLLSEAYDRKAPKAEIDELKRAIMAAKMELIEAASDIQLRGVATKMQDNN